MRVGRTVHVHRVFDLAQFDSARGQHQILGIDRVHHIGWRQAAFGGRGNPLAHLLRRQAVVVPNDADHRDIGLGEDIGRHVPQDERRREHDQDRHHDEGKGAPQRKLDHRHQIKTKSGTSLRLNEDTTAQPHPPRQRSGQLRDVHQPCHTDSGRPATRNDKRVRTAPELMPVLSKMPEVNPTRADP